MPLPTTARVIAIILIVMGVLGALFSCYGVLGLVGQLAGAADPQIPPTMDAEQAAAFMEYLDMAQNIGLYGAFPNLLSGFVSVFMAVSGILTLTQKKIGTSAIACFAAAVIDLLYMVFQIVTLVLLMPYMDGLFAAMIPPGEEKMAEFMSSFMNIAITLSGIITVLFGLGLAAFWGWAAIAMRNAAKEMAVFE